MEIKKLLMEKIVSELEQTKQLRYNIYNVGSRAV
jgi:hypothetical protein